MATNRHPRPESERRRYPRLPFSAPVIMVSASDVHEFRARDIGAGGVFLLAPRAPAVGTKVRVEFNAGKGRRFSVIGTVIRDETTRNPQGGPGFAIEFAVPEAERDEIGRALLDRDH